MRAASIALYVVLVTLLFNTFTNEILADRPKTPRAIPEADRS